MGLQDFTIYDARSTRINFSRVYITMHVVSKKKIRLIHLLIIIDICCHLYNQNILIKSYMFSLK